LCVAIMILTVLLPYMIVFAQNSISHQNEDWSHLGGYISGTLGIVSIFLLYLTYREQRATNDYHRIETEVGSLTNSLC
jgi:membrane protein DedA with SNARE-associated domain